MPKFVIERQYLLPIYQRLIIDAPDIATACRKAVENDDWARAPRRSMWLERSRKGSLSK
jgi:hypothetical protein